MSGAEQGVATANTLDNTVAAFQLQGIVKSRCDLINLQQLEMLKTEDDFILI